MNYNMTALIVREAVYASFFFFLLYGIVFSFLESAAGLLGLGGVSRDVLQRPEDVVGDGLGRGGSGQMGSLRKKNSY